MNYFYKEVKKKNMIKENDDVMYNNINGVEILQFKKLLEYQDIITHAYCLGTDRNFRTGRANNEIITEEELNKAVSDYRNLCDAINLDYNNIIKTKQRHTDNSEIITEKQIEGPDFNTFENTDGLITDKKKIVLSTTNADCILLLLFDPVKRVIANIHSGWKGTLQRISVKAIQKMKKEYGCEAENIIACMCPSIRKCHFEVGQDVYEEFYNEFKDINGYKEFFENIDGKWHIDTVLINRIILKKEGLLDKNIIDSGLCSVCNKEYMHSFRAEGENYKLNTAVISLK